MESESLAPACRLLHLLGIHALALLLILIFHLHCWFKPATFFTEVNEDSWTDLSLYFLPVPSSYWLLFSVLMYLSLWFSSLFCQMIFRAFRLVCVCALLYKLLFSLNLLLQVFGVKLAHLVFTGGLISALVLLYCVKEQILSAIPSVLAW